MFYELKGRRQIFPKSGACAAVILKSEKTEYSLLSKFTGAQERGRYLVNELSCFISVCGIHSRAEWSDFFFVRILQR